MKIAVVGCGAVGSYYGAKLCHDGQEVHFVLRSDYEVVRRSGVQVRSPQGDFRVRPKAARDPQEVGEVDLVLIGLKTTANAEFAKLLPPLVGPRTAVLTLQNGLGNEEQLARLFPVESILGGLCFVCLNRLQPGVIHHIDHGQIVLGEFQRWPEPRTHDIASMFRHAGVPCAVTDSLARSHWEKLTWNIPFNGLGVAALAGYEAVTSGTVPRETAAAVGASNAEDVAVGSKATSGGVYMGKCFTTDRLLGDAQWLELVKELIREVLRAARGLGFKVQDELVDKQIERTSTMGAYKASTLLDFERGFPLELESLFLEPLRQARAAGVPTPRLEGMCRVLQELDARRARRE